MDTPEIKTVDYKGRIYNAFYPRRDPATGPGWYVFGRGAAGEYDGRLITLCARPAIKARRHPHYNCSVRRGWRTRREAENVAQTMNKES